ncbi:hypothetical protein [Geodermatophilus sp. CPCC 205761]|uniref:hypothetical protein n=1 Tax=Geodermatophilus sp. CPCC 205761 TaxID=2936597 RepID=UPI003EE90276
MEPRPISHTEYGVGTTPGVPRPGSTSHEESGIDLESYLRPLEQAHAGALHGRGVAVGLAVRAVPGESVVRVTTGVAVDGSGRHVVLAPGGAAEVADDPTLGSVLVPVDGSGVELPTAGRSGACRVTVRWRETFDQDLRDQTGAFLTRHTPWLRLEPTAGGAPGPEAVALGTVTLDGTGRIVAGGADAGERGSVEAAAAVVRVRGSAVRPSADGLALEVGEVARAELRGRPGGGLDLRVGDPAGDPPALAVSSSGHVGIGTSTPSRSLDVAGGAAVSGSLSVGGRLRASDGVTLAGGPGDDAAGFHLTVGAVGETPVLRLHGGADDTGPVLLSVTSAGALTIGTATGRVSVQDDLSVRGALFVTNSSGGTVTISGRTWDNEADFSPSNLKVVMANRFLIPNRDRPFQFLVGYGRERFILGEGGLAHRFVRVFSVDDKGNAFFAGSKGGYVVDYFVNAVGGPLERGDVVVLRRSPPVASYGTSGAIPIPEVDLTDEAHDGRVCGIVADAVPAGGLPGTDPADDDGEASAPGHPLARYAGEQDATDATVADRRMGRMVTLGCWNHCKVDADIAPVEVGDLLTTSPTSGHAQKVTDRSRAPGTVLGKALAPLPGGRGTIPVLVALQ